MIASDLSPADDYRRRARQLLKDLRCADEERRSAAARRFSRLRTLGDAPAEVLARIESIRLKHALTVVALEAGYPAWTELKDAAEAAERDADATLMYVKGFDVLLNRWFARYEDARESRQQMGGYLLPYRNQFLVCESAAIRLLGLDPDDPDWERIDYDWVRPADRAAWKRLRRARLDSREAR